jgi:hypothetical protein
LFTGCRGSSRAMTPRQYARLLADWWQALASIPRCSARIPCAEPRQR